MRRIRRQRPAVPLEVPGGGARDAGLRRVLVRQLREAHGCADPPLVVEEMGLHHGQARADVAALSSVIHGFELKSERDNLRRLPLQVLWYGRVLDRCTIVAADGHLAHAMAVVPSWWGIKRVRRRGVELVLEQVREARPNPEQQLLDLARLLWRQEAHEELTTRDAARGVRGGSRLELYQRMLEVMLPGEVRATVIRRLRARHTSGLWP